VKAIRAGEPWKKVIEGWSEELTQFTQRRSAFLRHAE
jgi:hypothetical protein